MNDRKEFHLSGEMSHQKELRKEKEVQRAEQLTEERVLPKKKRKMNAVKRVNVRAAAPQDLFERFKRIYPDYGDVSRVLVKLMKNHVETVEKALEQSGQTEGSQVVVVTTQN